MQSSSQDLDKRTFTLVDDAGTWIRCCALGLTARARALANGNEVVLYFGTGRGGLGSSPGMVYFMKDSLAVLVGRRADVPTKRVEIPVQSD